MALTIQFFQTGAAAIPALTVIATQRPNMKYSHELARRARCCSMARCPKVSMADAVPLYTGQPCIK
jgi:hypothetical protein